MRALSNPPLLGKWITAVAPSSSLLPIVSPTHLFFVCRHFLDFREAFLSSRSWFLQMCTQVPSLHRRHIVGKRSFLFSKDKRSDAALGRFFKHGRSGPSVVDIIESKFRSICPPHLPLFPFPHWRCAKSMMIGLSTPHCPLSLLILCKTMIWYHSSVLPPPSKSVVRSHTHTCTTKIHLLSFLLKKTREQNSAGSTLCSCWGFSGSIRQRSMFVEREVTINDHAIIECDRAPVTINVSNHYRERREKRREEKRLFGATLPYKNRRGIIRCDDPAYYNYCRYGKTLLYHWEKPNR